MKSIIIIGSGMGGLTAGSYGQANGFATTIFEAHRIPGGQCTAWKRKGYVFDACLHYFGGGSARTRADAFWRAVGASPCEMIPTHECASVLFPDGTYFHDYYDLDKLRAHLEQFAPEDAALIEEYLGGIRRFLKGDLIGDLFLGSWRDKLRATPALLGVLKYFKYNLGTFGERFRNPVLRQAFPLLHSSLPGFPLFLHLSKHAYTLKGDWAWPKGGSLTVALNMAARYKELGGTIHYHQKVVKILTDEGRAYGVELADGSRHHSDFVVSNADGRKTIMNLLGGQYMDERIARYCAPNTDAEVPFSILVFLGVKRDLAACPSALVMFLEKPEEIAGVRCEHLDLQFYGYDTSMAPPGKGVIKIELFAKPSYFAGLYQDKAAYRAEKNRLADQVIAVLEQQFPGLREDVEAIDVATLPTWERYMGGTSGHSNYPNKEFSILGDVLGLEQRYTLPGLKNFYMAGQWVTSAGALFMNALSGRSVVQKICQQSGVKFTEPRVEL